VPTGVLLYPNDAEVLVLVQVDIADATFTEDGSGASWCRNRQRDMWSSLAMPLKLSRIDRVTDLSRLKSLVPNKSTSPLLQLISSLWSKSERVIVHRPGQQHVLIRRPDHGLHGVDLSAWNRYGLVGSFRDPHLRLKIRILAQCPLNSVVPGRRFEVG
jgi:hypothetical protein